MVYAPFYEGAYLSSMKHKTRFIVNNNINVHLFATQNSYFSKSINFSMMVLLYFYSVFYGIFGTW